MSQPVSQTSRWRGLAALTVDAVTHGSEAIERLQKEVVGRPLALVELIPKVGPVAKVVHVVHDGAVTCAHVAIRVTARATLSVIELGIDLAEGTPRAP